MTATATRALLTRQSPLGRAPPPARFLTRNGSYDIGWAPFSTTLERERCDSSCATIYDDRIAGVAESCCIDFGRTIMKDGISVMMLKSDVPAPKSTLTSLAEALVAPTLVNPSASRQASRAARERASNARVPSAVALMVFGLFIVAHLLYLAELAPGGDHHAFPRAYGDGIDER